MVAFFFLHTVGIILNVSFDTIEHYWPCSSTMGCTMTVGPNEVHFDNMEPLCNAGNFDDLANTFDLRGETMAFSCLGSIRCCTRCTVPLPSDMTEGSPLVVVRTRDELLIIFRRGLWIMVVALTVEVLAGIAVACTIHCRKTVADSSQEGPNGVVDIETVFKYDQIPSKCKAVVLLCIVVAVVVVVTDMCLLIGLILVPAISHLRNLSCFIYMIMYAISFLSTYVCIGVLIEIYITISNKMDIKHRCLSTWIWKVVLSIMGSLMWLVIICGLIVGAIYYVYFAITNSV
jgi:hypothetical protein